MLQIKQYSDQNTSHLSTSYSSHLVSHHAHWQDSQEKNRQEQIFNVVESMPVWQACGTMGILTQSECQLVQPLWKVDWQCIGYQNFKYAYPLAQKFNFWEFIPSEQTGQRCKTYIQAFHKALFTTMMS